MQTTDMDGWPAHTIAGFWRRIVALVIDGIILGAAGAALGALFFDAFARMGVAAKLIGFAIALAYFGILNSRIGRGQTAGKHVVDIRVVDVNNQFLSLPRSLLRYVVLGIPFFANGLPLDPTTTMAIPLSVLMTLIVFGGNGIIIYLYVFNRRTRQSLHDLAVGSYVEHFDRVSRPGSFPTMWRGHLLVAALLAVAILIAPFLIFGTPQSSNVSALLPLYTRLSQQPHVIAAQIGSNTRIVNGERPTNYLQAVLRLDEPLIDDEAMAKEVAQLMAKGDPDIAKEDVVVVVLAHGYDLGIASGWERRPYTFKPPELE